MFICKLASCYWVALFKGKPGENGDKAMFTHNMLFEIIRRRKPILGIVTIGLIVVPVALTTGAPNRARADNNPTRLILDVDTGVDDSAALTWLLTQDQYSYELLGIVTVTGTTTINNATNNVLTVLDVTGHQDIEVRIGASAPLLQSASTTGAFIHGPDGLWFVGFQHPHDLSGLSTNAVGF